MPRSKEPAHLRPSPTPATLEAMQRLLPGSDVAAAAPVLKLINLSRAISGWFETTFREIELTEARFSVVMMIYWAESQAQSESRDGSTPQSGAPNGPPTPSGLAEYAGVGRASMTQLLDGLEDTGWIERRTHPDDRRKLSVALTPSGRHTLEGFLPDHYGRLSALLADLSPRDRERLTALTDRLEATLANLAPKPPTED